MKEPSNPLPKCQSTIVVKIFCKVLSSKESIPTTFMCLVKRPVMLFRPPPGGPIAATNSWNKRKRYSCKYSVRTLKNEDTELTTSTMSSREVSFLSYQLPWSTHCLNNSIGGWAPYFSNIGMFRSSTNNTHSWTTRLTQYNHDIISTSVYEWKRTLFMAGP